VSASGTVRRRGRRRRRARSSAKRRDEGSGAQTLGPFFFRVTLSAGPIPSPPHEVARGFEMTALRPTVYSPSLQSGVSGKSPRVAALVDSDRLKLRRPFEGQIDTVEQRLGVELQA